MRELYPHQANALGLTRSVLGRGSKRVMLQAPTGFGKTVLMSHITAGARAKNTVVFIVVPSISLIDQTVRSLASDGITQVGVVQADHPMTDYTQPVQVVSVQSLKARNVDAIADRMSRENDSKRILVIVDEAHRWYKYYAEWMANWSAITFIGLSATPWTKGLAKHYDDLVIAATTASLIEAGFLSQFRVFAPAHPDLSDVRTVAGDYHEGELARAMMRGALVADIVTTWKTRGEGRPTLAFAVDRAHAKAIQLEFETAGVPCGYIDAHTDLDERQAIADRFHAGELKVVSNVGCLTTGVDWDVRCIILARPTKSEILFTQIIGRGLRTADGKDDCLILDHSDTHLRLGFVTDIEHEEMNDGTIASSDKTKTESKPLECPKCQFLRASKILNCPACGYLYQPVSDVETVQGDLEEMIPAAKRAINRKTTDPAKIAFYGGLKQLGLDRGYKPGWAANQYREKFGVWPNKHKDAKPCKPNDDVTGWIKHSNIRRAKGKAA